MSRLKYEDVKKEVENSGWKLITTSYQNLKTEMTFQCPEGHLNYFSFDFWRRKCKCPTCEQNPFFHKDTQPVKKEGYRILALDQASITSGWSVFDDGKLVKYGKWSSNGKHSVERISQTKYWVSSMIERWKPDLVVLEDIQLQNFNGQDGVLTFKKLAALQGVLKNYCFEIGLTYKVVPSSTWRHTYEIKGKTRTDKKKNAQIKVKQLYDISVDNDTAEAILIGGFAVKEYRPIKLITF